MPDLVNNFTSELQRQIDAFSPEVELKDVGAVLEAGDGIARVSGLSDVRAQELIQFANGVMGIAFNLERDTVGVLIMGEYSEINEGMLVYTTGRIVSVPVGEGLVGRVVNAL
ncbi:MAG: F0F1 ATP synthase subunit alpha, partial [Anaerolineales bacterium]|nr:F0F1 ATP synthase subunit alpha [Anaerolineales bacterium]